MTDSHVHIGQFEEVCYSAEKVFDAVFANGLVDSLVFSSTTSCVGGVKYGAVEAEINAALTLHGPEKTAPLFWFIPDYIAQGVNIEKAMRGLPYRGFKLHPHAQQWDFENSKHTAALRGVFDYSAQNTLPVLIHTGENGLDSPDRFAAFFDEYPSIRFILAHCRPLNKTIIMLKTYRNVFCDTAFVPVENIKHIAAVGLASKIIPGSDFPITHHFKTKYPHEGANSAVALREQYNEDTKGWKELFL
jgi:predicted TIM-barrel fold metal-dependent hydrolase